MPVDAPRALREDDQGQAVIDQRAPSRQDAAAIGPGLAKAALAIRANGGKWQDLSVAVPPGAKIEILTAKQPEALELLTSREESLGLLKLDGLVDLIIPRGSNALVRFIQDNTRIPVLGHADHRMPIRGLYLCGSGAHPGGGVTGAPGHNAAQVVITDWKRKKLR